MPRSMWKGVVSFGMVSIPIRLYNATESTAKVSFRQLCPEHNSPISYKRWCAEGDHEVARSGVEGREHGAIMGEARVAPLTAWVRRGF